MRFKEWLRINEVGTSSASVAVFARPVFGSAVRRTWPPMFGDLDKSRKKKKRKKR